ncbi:MULTISPECIES: bacillithiol biosynthesis cysteine-adding enzyme BshC [Chryseobacterium]|uniref:Putative cysteine ligase BshC n=1 Tax=Chryseobacterium camelliae TaxID=1265445 RepID=A0ABU0TND3_9FLAO|nr:MULTISPECIES: bacillithiol biosynthesis cysteine-adding enzyme BshC [Chryseobacterium]MDT3407595.1 bacillithiol biosynthesis cysteine-adding enzyme BshC [Pseudacidovorax intermedius]MDQ1098552.1 bacillithiol biosynthesis cysteine-adding enzyme BshC [Chryseobacterium camelliae]MDQ1102476.1 bacillithiol biosynthesis cysteine-adding enzyme BshC [Chryseobacterium sp. SORGH_AS_1048]MDR6085910.1 bacillithiol biosynthesis cysteine-adding enzyme BshC [Chryseobacterium sp. SORGH_AS_0909]MDR6130276.1
MKTIDTISFLDIESIPQLIKDFLNQDVKGFEDNIFTLNAIKMQIHKKQESFTPEQRAVLYQALKQQLSGMQLSSEQEENLDHLKLANTFTITTGHQLNLFSGPVFFVYKILQTIKTCSYLKQHFPEFNFVPVYWMATEDHDFAEINHFRTENNYYEINEKSGGPVGRITVSDTFFISEFEEEFKDSVFGTELILMLKEAYKNGNTLTEAIRIFVNRIFSGYGLISIDGDCPILKQQIKDIFKDELVNFSLYESSRDKVALLTGKYGKVQVNPREINLFYLTETRDRIDFDGSSYFVVDKNIRFTKDELIHELEKFPEKFSPNALMRPVYQEKVLPNLAYIGGNAEIMYWMELKDYFFKTGIPFPVLIPRNSMLFIKEKTVKKIEKLSLKPQSFFQNFAKVVDGKILENHEILRMLEDSETNLINQFSQLKAVAETTDKSFGNMVRAEEVRQLKSFTRMKKRLLHAEKIKQNELMERLETLFLEVHPAGTWQERVYNFSVFFADYGYDWLESCLEKMVVEESKLIIVAI